MGKQNNTVKFGVPECSGVPVFRRSGVPVFRGVPGCSGVSGCSGVFRCSGVPGFSTCPLNRITASKSQLSSVSFTLEILKVTYTEVI